MQDRPPHPDGWRIPIITGNYGQEYAAWDGEEPAVALAIEEHYLPRFAADKIPSSIIGAIVGLADKFDTISGCFALGLHPTGSQDPYSLRRHAYGIIRIIEEHGFTLMLEEVLGQSLSILMSQTQSSLFTSDKLIPEIKNFFRERLFHTNIEKGCSHDLVNAVLNAGAGFDDMYDFYRD